MKTIVAVALAMLLGPAPIAQAQACRTISLAAADVHVEALKLYDRDGHLQGRLRREALPEHFDVSDCGDRTYLMLVVEDKGYFIHKTELATPEMPSACVCLPAGARPQTLGVPGGGDIRYCPVDQCHR